MGDMKWEQKNGEGLQLRRRTDKEEIMPKLFNNSSRTHINLYLSTLIYNMYDFMFRNSYICVYVCVIVTERQTESGRRERVDPLGLTILPTRTKDKQKSRARHEKLSFQVFGHSNTNDSQNNLGYCCSFGCLPGNEGRYYTVRPQDLSDVNWIWPESLSPMI